MPTNNKLYYSIVEKIIDYAESNENTKVSLQTLANFLQIKQSEVKQIFLDWSGTSPKQFLKFIDIDIIDKFDEGEPVLSKNVIPENNTRINIVAMKQQEYLDKNNLLNINYSFASSYFGDIIIASTLIGICYIAFVKNKDYSILDLHKRFPFAKISYKKDLVQVNILPLFDSCESSVENIQLHIKASDFQLRVWNKLLEIPFGQLWSYSELANSIGNPKAVRAVASAVGKNPISYIIPCHRIIRASGKFGEYFGGSIRKKAIIGWEKAQLLKVTSKNSKI